MDRINREYLKLSVLISAFYKKHNFYKKRMSNGSNFRFEANKLVL